MLISVIIPCYNSEKYIFDCLESVIKQSYKNLEIIVVDDGSTDKTSELVKKFEDERIKYYYKKNGGLATARNYGIDKSSGQLIAFLDSDDSWREDKLEKQLTLIDTCDVIYSDYMTTDFKGMIIPNKVKIMPQLNKNTLKKELLFGNVILGSGSGVLMKRDVIKRIGEFNTKLKVAEDWDYWARAAWANFKFGYVNEKLVIIKFHNSSMQNSTDKLKMKESIQMVLESFFSFTDLTNHDKALIYKRLAFNSYHMANSFKELFNYYLKSVKYNKLQLFDPKLLYLIIKYLPKNIKNEVKRLLVFTF